MAPPRFKSAPVVEEETQVIAPAVPRFKAAPVVDESLPEQSPIQERPKEGVEFFEWYLGPTYKPMTTLPNGGKVYKDSESGELAYWSPFGETQDKKTVIKLLSGKPEAEVLKGRKRELVGGEVMKSDPIGTRIRQTASGLPFVGEFIDELTGAIRGTAAEEAYRAQLQAFEAERPVEAGGYKVLGGVAGTPPGIPLTAGRGILQRTVTGGVSGAVLGAAEGAASGYGRGETPEERERLAKEGGQLGALVGGVVGAGIEPVSIAAGNIARLLKRTDINVIAKEFGISKDAAKTLQSAFLRSDYAEARRILDDAGSTAMLADAGQAAKTLLDSAIIQGSPEAASVGVRNVDPRVRFQFKKLSSVLDGVLGKPRGMGQVLEGIQSVTRQQRKAMYDKALANQIDPAVPQGRTVMDQVGRQVDQSVIDTVNASYRAASSDPNAIRQISRKFDPKTGAVIFDPPLTVGDIDKIVRTLEDKAQSLHKDVNPLAFGISAMKSEQGRDVEGLAQRIRDNARQLFPDYDMAVRTAKDTIQQRQAALLGEELLKPSTTREHVQEALKKATKEEREAMKAGLRSAVDELAANARISIASPDPDINALRDMFNKFSSPASREKIAALLGPSDAARMFSALEEAKIALELRGAVSKGSATALRTATSGKMDEITAPGIRELAAQGKWGQMQERIVQSLTGFRPEDLARRREFAWDEIASVLTTIQGPEAKRALGIIERAIAGQKVTDKQAQDVANFIRKQMAPAVVGAETAAESRNKTLRYNPETGEVE